MLTTFATPLAIVVTWWQLGLPRVVLSAELKAIHDRTDRVERFNEDTAPLVLDQAW